MKNDSISDLKAGDEVTLRGVVEQTTPYAVKVRFPGMHLAAWLTQDAVKQPHFVRSAPPAVCSYAALRYACDRLKAENERIKAELRDVKGKTHEVLHKMPQLQNSVLHLMNGISTHTQHNLMGLRRNLVNETDTLVDLVSQARDAAMEIQSIWETLEQ